MTQPIPFEVALSPEYSQYSDLSTAQIGGQFEQT